MSTRPRAGMCAHITLQYSLRVYVFFWMSECGLLRLSVAMVTVELQAEVEAPTVVEADAVT